MAVEWPVNGRGEGPGEGCGNNNDHEEVVGPARGSLFSHFLPSLFLVSCWPRTLHAQSNSFDVLATTTIPRGHPAGHPPHVTSFRRRALIGQGHRLAKCDKY